MVFYKVLALGYKRFAWLELPNGYKSCVKISNELYTQLRLLGVPTSQKIARNK